MKQYIQIYSSNEDKKCWTYLFTDAIWFDISLLMQTLSVA